MTGIFDRFWHGWVHRPYKLARTVNQGRGLPVVLLHGIGRSNHVWDNVIKYLKPLDLRIVAFDLLGFGASPKPKWPAYDVDDHARAVIASLNKMRFGQPAILVGHSMGCLVAVRVARLRPDLVRHLVLYEMPLYEGLPEKRIYKLRTDLYFKIYKRITRYQPVFSREKARLAEKLAVRIAGFEIKRASWLPFIRSLENTIMRQTAADDIKHISIPMDVIYGSFDMLVIRGKPQAFFGSETKERIKSFTIRAGHEISPRSAKFIVKRIKAVL